MGNPNRDCQWPNCSCKTAQNEPCKFEDPDFYINRAQKRDAAGVDIMPKAAVKTLAGTIDLTPTWSSILPMLLTLYENGAAAGRKTATEELAKMARLADNYVESQRPKL